MKRLAITLGILAFLYLLVRDSLCHSMQLLDQTTYVENMMTADIDTGKTELIEAYQTALHNPSNTAFASDINQIYQPFTDASRYTEYISSDEDRMEQQTCDTLFNKIRTSYASAEALALSDTLKVAIRESGQKISGSEMQDGFYKLKKSGGAKLILSSMQWRLLEDGAKCLRQYAGRQ